MLALFVRIERRVAEPLVDLGTLTQRAMAATNATTVLVGFSMTAFFVILPAFVQVPDGLAAPLDYGFGASPVQTGLFFVPCSVAMIVAGPVAGALGTRHGFGLVLRAGLVLMAAGFSLLAAFHGQQWTPYVWLAVMGTGVAFALAATGALVIAHAPAKQSGVAGRSPPPSSRRTRPPVRRIRSSAGSRSPSPSRPPAPPWASRRRCCSANGGGGADRGARGFAGRRSRTRPEAERAAFEAHSPRTTTRASGSCPSAARPPSTGTTAPLT
jgi:Major Facilitator Superfamily